MPGPIYRVKSELDEFSSPVMGYTEAKEIAEVLNDTPGYADDHEVRTEDREYFKWL